MGRYKRAAEMAMAFSVVIKEIQTEFNRNEAFSIENESELEELQALVGRLVLLERDLGDLIESAISIETGLRDKPFEILDFSSEWEKF